MQVLHMRLRAGDKINGLKSVGINQNVAKLITYLKDVDEGSSRDRDGH